MSSEFREVPGALREEERFANDDDFADAEKRRDEALEAAEQVPAAQAEAEAEALKARQDEVKARTKTLQERTERRSGAAKAERPEVKSASAQKAEGGAKPDTKKDD